MPFIEYKQGSAFCSCKQPLSLKEKRRAKDEYDVYVYTYGCKNGHEVVSVSEIKKQ